MATGLAIQADVRAGRVERAAQHFVDYWSGAGTWQTMEARRRQVVCVRIPKVARDFGALFDDAVPLSAYMRLTMPVLWLEGETTRLPPQAIAGRLLPALAGARHVRVAGAGHMGPITHSEAVNAEILRFVRGLDHRHRPGSSRMDAAATTGAPAVELGV
jgi:pimeloyl-ACP methyl ester carboxylesterase